MGARVRSWWQKIIRPLSIIGIIIVSVLVIALIVGIIGGYVFNWNWTGLSQKTLWDWMQLLIIPLALAIIALVFQLANTRTERQIAKQRYEQDQQIALDKQHEDLLQAYLDRVSELLLKESILTSPSGEGRNVARVRTITVLTQLNARRIGSVFTFLREAGLMSTTSNSSVVSLKDADLRAVKWGQANLSNADLERADLRGANLSNANFSGAHLTNADLRKAHLNEANFSGATFFFADLSSAFLYKTNFSGALLLTTKLSGAIFIETDLSQADLSGATIITDNSIEPNH